jgi:hypothetical protein
VESGVTELWDEITAAEFEYVEVEKDGKLYELKSVRNRLDGDEAWLTYAIDLDDAYKDKAGFYTLLEENLKEGNERGEY